MARFTGLLSLLTYHTKLGSYLFSLTVGRPTPAASTNITKKSGYGPQSRGGWLLGAKCRSDIPVSATQAETMEELRLNLREAIEGCSLSCSGLRPKQADDQVIELAR
jgi:hypothetical protein